MSPKELAELGDEFWTVLQERLAADRAAALLKTKESKLQAQIVEEMRKENVSAIGGQRVSLTLKKEDVPTAESWEKVWGYIQETGQFDLLEKRLGKLACKERWENGIEIPGVVRFPVYKLSKSEVK
jgi:hypothetical protein